MSVRGELVSPSGSSVTLTVAGGLEDNLNNLNMLVFHRLPTPVPYYSASTSGSSSNGERSLSREPSASALKASDDVTGDSYSKTKTFSFFSDVLPRPRPPLPVHVQTEKATSSSKYLNSELESSETSLTPTVANANMSANDSFFFSTSLSRPTPPPSLRSHRTGASDGVVSPRPKASALPPLERFFPSRHRGHSPPPPDITPRPRNLEELDNDTDIHNEPSSISRSWSQNHPHRLPSPPPPIPSIKIPFSPPSTASSVDTDEPEPLSPPLPLEGSTIGADNNTPIHLIRQLGSGSFSTVWLAKDISGLLTHTDLTKHPKKGWRTRLKSESAAKRKRDWKVRGLKPNANAVEKPSVVKDLPLEDEGAGVARQRSVVLRPPSPSLADKDDDNLFEEEDPLVAVKMMGRNLCDADDRMRISFVREVEVLRHISHPSIVSYLHSFTTPTHHALVLEHIPGGELFNILNDDQCYDRMAEGVMRRIWSELIKAVGWMHSVGVVHRDVKLENILLTTNPLINNPPSLPPSSSPLIKLTDFNLSRFIDFSTPLLCTKCGSEAYAAPEIITSKFYDGRQTDAWACGVVLYGMACRRLPFESPDHPSFSHSSSNDDPWSHSKGRQNLLRRIASGSYSYPSQLTHPSSLLVTPALKQVIGRLLVRDPSRRARLDSGEIWEEEWMRPDSDGSVRRPRYHLAMNSQLHTPPMGISAKSPNGGKRDEFDEFEGELVDRNNISGVARREIDG